VQKELNNSIIEGIFFSGKSTFAAFGGQVLVKIGSLSHRKRGEQFAPRGALTTDGPAEAQNHSPTATLENISLYCSTCIN
jgi:hypothetical protein